MFAAVSRGAFELESRDEPRAHGWIEGAYHHAPRRGLRRQTKWARTNEGVRMPESNVSDLFLSEQRRCVQKGRIVTLDRVAS
jgi:hypothetical protein